MNLKYKNGFSFGFDETACKKCKGNCCRGQSGRIWLNQKEMEQIASFLKSNLIDFIEKYLEKSNNRYSIREHVVDDDYRCVFFDEERASCAIYHARPAQCKTFPFWDHFRNRPGIVLSDCPGIRMI